MRNYLLRIAGVLLCICCFAFGIAAGPQFVGAAEQLSANATAAATSIKLNKTTLSLKQGATAKLTATISPSAASGGVIWKSSSPTVATVDGNGNVTAVGGGTAVIYAVAADHTDVSAGCVVTVTGGTASGIKLNASSKSLNTGQTFILKATLTGGSINGYGVAWSSNNESVASVTNGIVTAHAPGTAVITAAKDGKSASCTVTVKQLVTSIKLSASSKTINVTDQFKLTATVSPSNASNKKVKWTSSNAAVATVDANGNVKGVSGGTATITATAQDGSGKTASCKVTVATTIKLQVYSGTIHKGQTLYNKATKNTSAAVKWSSSNPSVATVANGFIEGKGVGTATITAEVNGMRANCTVTVTAEEPVIMAYCKPNIAAPNEEVQIQVLTPTSQKSVQIKQNGNTIASATSGYTDKTKNGRTVRIWTLKTKFSTQGTISLTAHAGNSKEGKSFTAYITSAAGSSSPVVANRRASDEALLFRTQYEGYCPTIVYDVVNVATIGYGNALSPGAVFYNNQTEEEAYGNMVNLVNGVFTSELNTFTSHYGIALRQQQFDALLNFSYNYGAYGWRNYDFYLRRLLVDSKNGDKIDILQLKYAFGRLSYTGGYFYEGLYRGRMDEWEMFTKGDYNVHPYSDMTGDFAIPSKEEREDPNKYKGDWIWHGQWY